jgi:hypothetical protein
MARMDFALFVKFQLYGLPGAAALIGVNNLLLQNRVEQPMEKREKKTANAGLAVI